MARDIRPLTREERVAVAEASGRYEPLILQLGLMGRGGQRRSGSSGRWCARVWSRLIHHYLKSMDIPRGCPRRRMQRGVFRCPRPSQNASQNAQTGSCSRPHSATRYGGRSSERTCSCRPVNARVRTDPHPRPPPHLRVTPYQGRRKPQDGPAMDGTSGRQNDARHLHAPSCVRPGSAHPAA